jgi:hypothetical protein
MVPPQAGEAQCILRHYDDQEETLQASILQGHLQRQLPPLPNHRRLQKGSSPTTPWTELILEGLNLNPRKKGGIVLTIIMIAALVAASAATIGGVYLAEELERQKLREELYAGVSALTLDGVAQLSSTQEELNKIAQEVVLSLESDIATYCTSEHVNLLITAVDRCMESSSAPWIRRSPSSASRSSISRALP